MKKRKLLLVFILITIIAGIAVGANYSGWFGNKNIDHEPLPDVKDEYRKLCEKFMQRDSAMQIAGTVRLYDGKHNSVVKETSTFRYFKKGKQFYARFDYLETMCDGQYVVQLDTVEQIIVVTKAGEEQAPANAMAAFDLLFSDTAAFKMSGSIARHGSNLKISLQSDLHPGIRVSTITYDPQSYRLRNAEIEWWKNEWNIEPSDSTEVWITRMDYHYLPAGDMNISERIGTIVQVKKDTALLGIPYKDFRLYVAL